MPTLKFSRAGGDSSFALLSLWGRPDPMNSNFRNFALWVVIFLLVLALVTLFQSPGQRGGGSDIAYSQLLNEADAGRITNVVISGPEISGTYHGRPHLHDLRAERSDAGHEAAAEGRADHRPAAVGQHALVHRAAREHACPSRSSSAPGSSCRARCRAAPAGPWASASPRRSF